MARPAKVAPLDARAPPPSPAGPLGGIARRRDRTVPEMVAVRRRFAAATILAALVIIAVLALVTGLSS